MAVDFSKTRKLLVVHGVQWGDDSDIKSNEEVEKTINQRVLDRQLTAPKPDQYNTQMFRYEDINDESYGPIKNILRGLGGRLIPNELATTGIDITGDVVNALLQGETYNLIKNKLKETILANYEQGEYQVVLAHSLGSVYAFDAINELMQNTDYFNQARVDWPVQSLCTIGSPLPLWIFDNRQKTKVRGGDTTKFQWTNIYDETDPIISGSLLGVDLGTKSRANEFQPSDSETNWFTKDMGVDTRSFHLGAHFGYWENSDTADELIKLIAGV